MTGQDLLNLTDGDVLTSVENGVLTLTLNRPQTLNAVGPAMLQSMESVIRAASTSDDVRAVVLKGEGKGFSSGADLDPTGPPSTETLDLGAALVAAITYCPKPVVSVVHGPCAGIGVSIALAADLVVASQKAFFLLAFANIGLMPDGGATALVAASVGRARAMRMSLLGERISAQQAYDWGLITHLSEVDGIDADVATLLEGLATGPSLAYAETKKAVNAATLGELNHAFVRERYGQTSLMTSEDFTEGVTAFLERRDAAFRGR